MAEDDTEDGTIIVIGRAGWPMILAIAKLDEGWRIRRQRRRLAVLWSLAGLSALAAIWASGWTP